MTGPELVEVLRAGYAAATSAVTAGHAAPAEVTAAPAVILRPADPWVVPNRKIGACAEIRWAVQLIGGRFDLEASLAQMVTGYLGAITAARAAGVGQIGPLGLVDPTNIAGVDLLSGTFTLTLHHDPGGP